MNYCLNLMLFWDGELSEEESRAFQDHLVTCEACQVELDALAQFDALALRYSEPRARRSWWRRQLARFGF